MTSLAERLGGGDLRSIGDAEGVARELVHDRSLVAEAVGLMSGSDPLLRSRSADALEKAARRDPAILRRHKQTLLRLMTTARQQEVRWHIAQMLPLMAMTPRERRAARKTLRGYLEDESRIVRVCALQALWDLATSEERSRELRQLLERLTVEGSPAVQARARRLLGVGSSKVFAGRAAKAARRR